MIRLRKFAAPTLLVGALLFLFSPTAAQARNDGGGGRGYSGGRSYSAGRASLHRTMVGAATGEGITRQGVVTTAAVVTTVVAASCSGSARPWSIPVIITLLQSAFRTATTTYGDTGVHFLAAITVRSPTNLPNDEALTGR